MSSELFGYEKGSFTSASAQKKGLFEVANSGSIFLDDIDDVPLDIQAKLLRVLESRELMHVGGTVPIPIDVRLITASKVDLKTLVDRKLFRDDLYYRLNVVPIEIPALRDRSDDIPVLIEHFLNKYAPGRSVAVSEKAMQALTRYCWPGNIRELRNLVQRLALIADAEIGVQHLPSEVASGCKKEKLEMSCSLCFKEGNMPYNELVRNIESNIINEVLRRAYGNQSEAARILGLSLSTLRDKMKKLNLDSQSSKSQQN
jgi:DNA-binding NtrC family response regulator